MPGTSHDSGLTSQGPTMPGTYHARDLTSQVPHKPSGEMQCPNPFTQWSNLSHTGYKHPRQEWPAIRFQTIQRCYFLLVLCLFLLVLYCSIFSLGARVYFHLVLWSIFTWCHSLFSLGALVYFLLVL